MMKKWCAAIVAVSDGARRGLKSGLHVVARVRQLIATIARRVKGTTGDWPDVDEFTRRRMDDDAEEPDYGLVLDIRGYRVGRENRVRWQVIPVATTANIDIEDGVYIAEVLEKVIVVLRAGKAWREED